MTTEEMQALVENEGVDIKDLAGALKLLKKNKERAKIAESDRAKMKIFLSKWHNGCPSCGHTQEITQDEIDSYLAIKNAQGIKL